MTKLPKWLPDNVAHWYRDNIEANRFPANLTAQERALAHRLVTDLRMRPVWAWAAETMSKTSPNLPLIPVFLFHSICRAFEMPQKPGDLPPGKRAEYLKKVRHHTFELIKLLKDTRWDCRNDEGTLMPDDPKQWASDDIEDALLPGGDGQLEYERLILRAYMLTEKGIVRLPKDFPASHLTAILNYLFEWTCRTDNFGRDRFKSSKPIRHRNQTIFFTRTLYDTLAREWSTIPLSHLADLANVAFELDPPIDETTVQKQIERSGEKKSSEPKAS
jgi:hypothetical protein